MDSAVAQRIIQDQSIAYAITDRSFRIIEFGGNLTHWLRHNDSKEGSTLFDCAPELIGHEQDLLAVLHGISPRFELSLVNREVEPGTINYFSLVNLPYSKDDNQITGIIHCIEDLTAEASAERLMLQQRNELFLVRNELQKQNQKLQAAITELQQLDRLKSQFVTVAAHELRNPIATIMLYARTLLDEPSEAAQQHLTRNIGVIYRNAERLSRITGNMMDLLKLEIGQMELMLKPANLAAIMEKIDADMEPLLREKKQRLRINYAPDLPMALCDEDRVIQILNNLIHNASKYSAEGSEITLSAYWDEHPNYLHVEICDSGIGIPKAEQHRLFESFFRASNTQTVNVSGSGLGLSIVRALVGLHGGRIWIDSNEGQGTTVHLLFLVDE